MDINACRRGEPALKRSALPASAATMWPTPAAMVHELCERFVIWAASYYLRPDGTPTGQHELIGYSCQMLRDLDGDSDPATLTVDHLYQVQQQMLDRGRRRDGQPYSQRYINDTIKRIRQMIEWAARPPRRWVLASVAAEMQVIEPLRCYRSTARECDAIAPVSWDHVQAVVNVVPAPVAAMTLVQWHSGCRPGEVVIMREADIDRTGPVWQYRPEQHKTGWRLHVTCQRQGVATPAPLAPEPASARRGDTVPRSVRPGSHTDPARARKVVLDRGIRPGQRRSSMRRASGRRTRTKQPEGGVDGGRWCRQAGRRSRPFGQGQPAPAGYTLTRAVGSTPTIARSPPRVLPLPGGAAGRPALMEGVHDERSQSG